MAPGVYIIAGGGFNVSGNASLMGSGVLIDNTGGKFPGTGGGYGAISVSGNASIQLSAPTTGPYAGILIFQSGDNTQAITISGNGSLGLNGTIYAPAALMNLGGNAKGTAPLIVNELDVSGNTSTVLASRRLRGHGSQRGRLDVGPHDGERRPCRYLDRCPGVDRRDPGRLV